MNNEKEPEDAFCLNCGSTDLYRDLTSDDLICSVCNTKCQNFSQRETADDDFNAINPGKRHNISSSAVRIEDDFYTKDHVLPSLSDCVETFLSLVEAAAKRSVAPDLMPLPTPQNESEEKEYAEIRQNVVEHAKEIFFLYLERFDESANYFMIKYPKLRISLKDRFLSDSLREKLWMSLHVHDQEQDEDVEDTSGNQVKDEDTSENEEHTLNQSTQTLRSPKQVRWSDSQNMASSDPLIDSGTLDPNTRGPTETPTNQSFLRVNGFVKKGRKGFGSLTDDSLFWKLAVLEIKLDLNFLTSVVYLAHLCCQTGISSNHFVMWASSYRYPYLQDCFQQLSPAQKKNMRHVRQFFYRHREDLPHPSTLDSVAILLLSSLLDMSGREEDEDELPCLFRANIQRMKSIELLSNRRRLSKLFRGDGMSDSEVTGDVVNSGQSELVQGIEQEAESAVSDSQASTFSQELLQLGQASQESQENDEEDNTDESHRLAREPFYNAGMMAARFCAYIGVERKVLDFTYALMGLPVYCSMDDSRREEWLPSPLKRAHPSMLVTPVHIIAVIVAACKFTPGWTKWKVFRNMNGQGTIGSSNGGDHSVLSADDDKDDCDDDDDSISSYSSDESFNVLSLKRNRKRTKIYTHKAKRKKVTTKTNPIGETPQFMDRNGLMRFDYLDFMETMGGVIENPKKSISDFFRDTLSFSFWKTYKDDDLGNNDVRANPIVAGATVEPHSAHALELNESNGICDYVPYHAIKTFQKGGEAVHGPYKVLLGHFANRLFVDKHNLHYLVTLLDEEILLNAAKRNRMY